MQVSDEVRLPYAAVAEHDLGMGYLALVRPEAWYGFFDHRALFASSKDEFNLLKREVALVQNKSRLSRFFKTPVTRK